MLERASPQEPVPQPWSAGRRGQRLMQASSDIFLGWIRAPGGIDYYWRQLRDMKGSAVVEDMVPEGYLAYAGHLRVGARSRARPLGRPGRDRRLPGQERRVLEGGRRLLGETYADQTERDHQTMLDAIAKGKIKAEVGI